MATTATPKAKRLAESVSTLIGPPAKTVLEKREKIDYADTKAPNFSSGNQPGKKKKNGDDD